MPKPIALPCLLLLTLLVGCASTPSRPHSVEFTLVASNVQNFFDAFDDPYTQDETAWPKPKEPSIALGRALAATNPDFLGIEEIENEGILLRFRGWNLANSGYDYHYCAQSIGSRGINNAFLSRIPTRPITVHKFERFALPSDPTGYRFTFARHPVEAILRPSDDIAITAIVVHLKSKRTVVERDPKAANWRTAEAHRLRAMVDAKLDADPDALIVVMGDFNDTPDSLGIRALLDPDANGRVALIDPHNHIPKAESDTYLKKPYRSRIDFIMLSPALAKHVVDGSAKIYNQGDVGSDHAPVAVSLKLPTAQPDARKHWPTGVPERELRTYFKKPKKPADAK